MRLVEAAGTEIVPMRDIGAERPIALMEKYHDVPMDLVDALLVALGETSGVNLVLTLDRRGFETYRLRGRQRFRLLP